MKKKINDAFYIIYFTDKNHNSYSVDKPQEFLSERSIKRRTRQNISLNQRDLPVSKFYIDSIKQIGANVLYTSKWLNAALVKNESEILETIENLSFVVHKENIAKSFRKKNDTDNTKVYKNFNSEVENTQATNYGGSFNQTEMLGINHMHEAGFNGEGINIAILDAGFRNTNKIAAFNVLFTNDLIIDTYDFVDQEKNVYDDHHHGTEVLSVVGAYWKNKIIGPAFKSSYYLFRTEEVERERKTEEFYWLVGAERADSLGADIILSSLGYSTFDNTVYNHTTTQLDGNTALVTKAADWAASAGILVVISAGNEGGKIWKKITFPADADSILSVGAVNSQGEHANFSSVGPTEDGRIKPDVVAQGSSTSIVNQIGKLITSSGTSYSAPLVAGLAAGLWQAYPNLSNIELIKLIRESASKNSNPDNKLGYGIPSFTNIRYMNIVIPDQAAINENIECYTNPINDRHFTIYFPDRYKRKTCIVNISTLEGKNIYHTKKSVNESYLQIQLPYYADQIYILHLRIKKINFSFKLLVNN